MPGETETLTERERRLLAVMQEYLQAVDSGHAPTPNEVLTRYPDLAAELTVFFHDQEGLSPLLPPLRQLAAAATPVPTRLGDYEILEAIGRGGMGVVYRARQVSLNRFVAVKLVRDRALASPVELARFRQEAESAAHLDHPHIAPIYEVGEQAGQLFFSMKLIDGGSLAAALGAARDCTAPRAAATLVATVARAVHHAHQRGILHRDLKPSNILLDAQGVPYVTDFGLAKRLEGGDRLTQSGAIVGTPEYLAPEQAQAVKRLTTAADVYSLGVVLYELLTGRVPFRGDNEWQTVRLVVEQEPAPVRTHAPEVDRDLETICLKCLAKDPERRYGSAEALAAELERWLAGVPITARPVGRLERAWRWCRRNPAQAGLAAAVLLLIIGAAAAPSVGLVLLRAEQQQTEAARLGAVAAREDEARRRQQTRQALDLLTGPVIEDWLGKQQALSSEQQKFLEEALAIYTEFTAETSTDEASRAGLARAYLRVGTIQSLLGRKSEAEVAYRRGAALYAQLASEMPDRIEYRKLHLGVLNHLVVVLNNTGRSAQAEAAQRDLIQRQRLLAVDSGDLEIRTQLALNLSNLGALIHRRGNVGEAATVLREAVTHFEELAAHSARRVPARHGQATALMNLGGVLERTGKPAEAERAYQDALKWLKQLAASASLAKHREVRQDLGNAHTCLGNLLRQTKGRLRDAEAAHREALKVRQELSAEFPGHPSPRGDVADTYSNLGIVLASLNQLGDAEEAYRKAMSLYEGPADGLLKNPENLYRLARVHSRLGLVLDRRERPEEAETEHLAANRLLQELVAGGHGMPTHQYAYAVSLINLAQRHVDRKEWPEARRLLEEAVPHHQAALKTNPLARDYQQCRRMNWYGLAQVVAEQQDHAGLAAAATQLAEAAADAQVADLIEKAAAFLARCVILAEQDSQLPDTRRAELAQSYAERAMSTLRLAVKHGFKNTAVLKKEPFFASVRSRPDFQELVTDLEKMRKLP